MNVVMNNGGGFIEVQGTAEGHAFRRHELDQLLDLAAAACEQLFVVQTEALQAPLPDSGAESPAKAGERRTAFPAAGAGTTCGKRVREMRDILRHGKSSSIAGGVHGQGADETALTFVENALLKARHARVSHLPRSRTIPAGVDALQARRNLFARYAGRARRRRKRRKVQRECSRCRTRKRTARLSLRHGVPALRGDPPLVVQAHWAGRFARFRAAAEASATTRSSSWKAVR
jgi:inosine/xanthosine triphosphate pyrophosphatase family protein